MFIERVSEAKHFKKSLCKKLLRKLVIKRNTSSPTLVRNLLLENGVTTNAPNIMK